MRIDAHQHFWHYDAVRDAWINDQMSVLKKDFLPGDLIQVLEKNNIDGCVSVQASQSEDETIFLNEFAEENNWILGVVGWVDLRSPNVTERLQYFSSFKKIKGWRHIVQGETPGFMLRPEFVNGIQALSNFSFTYDVLIYANQIAEATELVKRFPNQKFIVDHLAKPVIKEKEFDSWARQMKLLSECSNVWCKLSGMVTEADWHSWSHNDLRPYLDAMVESFGSKRLVYGSDWPVCLVASTYASQLKVYEDYFASFSANEQADIFGKNAVRFYSL